MVKALFAFTLALVLSNVSVAADVPGGLIRSADSLPTNTYELVLTPGYTFRPNGAYMSAEIRYQPNEDFGVGFGFGAGEAGFNFGMNGSWFIVPDMENQPGVSILAGAYFNRVTEINYFNVKVAPIVSKRFEVEFGRLTPYGGLHISPSFRLGQPENTVAVKATLGSNWEVHAFNGLKVFTEGNLGLNNSIHELLVGFSYPFAAL